MATSTGSTSSPIITPTGPSLSDGGGPYLSPHLQQPVPRRAERDVEEYVGGRQEGCKMQAQPVAVLGCKGPRLQQIAARVEKTPAQVVFHFCQQVGMLPLTGTSDPAHMQQDLDWDSFSLTPEEVSGIERMGLQR